MEWNGINKGFRFYDQNKKHRPPRHHHQHPVMSYHHIIIQLHNPHYQPCPWGIALNSSFMKPDSWRCVTKVWGTQAGNAKKIDSAMEPLLINSQSLRAGPVVPTHNKTAT